MCVNLKFTVEISHHQHILLVDSLTFSTAMVMAALVYVWCDLIHWSETGNESDAKVKWD